jgi:mannose-6-phosphate isomerase-like protein (cupin superfamily)
MLPRILHPEQLQGYRLSEADHCRLALLSRPGEGNCTLFLEIHDACDRVPPHAHHHAAELFFVLRGTVIFHVGETAIHARGGDCVVVPEETMHDLENPGPERVYLLTVLSSDDGFAAQLQQGIPTPLDATDLAVLRNL